MKTLKILIAGISNAGKTSILRVLDNYLGDSNIGQSAGFLRRGDSFREQIG